MATALPAIQYPTRAEPGLALQYSNWVAATLVMSGFIWRLWLAHATFFNTDEAWHYSLANQSSLYLAYKASLTIPHPPLLVLVLYFWRSLGTSNLVLRLPNVLAGTLLCWVYWKWLTALVGQAAGWVALILLTFLPPMIATSADLRQYPPMLLFTACAAYFLERALAENSVRWMTVSTVCLYLAMLSTYSAFFVAAALGGYCILRMRTKPPSLRVISAWGAGQAGGLALACFLYMTHIAKNGPLQVPWLHDYYFHAGGSHLLSFLYHGTFGVFRFVFGQITIGGMATLMFAMAVVLLLLEKPASETRPSSRLIGILLLLPFVLNCAAVIAGLYPYGRTRQCIFLAVFAISGVGVFLARIAKQKTGPAIALAIFIVVACHAFGTLQGRDMLPLADQRHEHMDQAMDFIHREVSPADVILVDDATRRQLVHYLCRQQPISVNHSLAGFELFQCEGFRVISTGPEAGVLTAEAFATKWREMVRIYSMKPSATVWVFQGGWAAGLGEALRERSADLQPHPFGRYLEIFKLQVAPPDGAGQG